MSRSLRAVASSFVLALAALPVTVRADYAQPSPPSAEVRALLREGQLDRGVERGEALVASHPDDAELWLQLGRVYAQQAMRAGLLSRASWASKCREAYEKAVALAPRNPEALFDLMQFHIVAPGFLGGDDDRAREEARTIASLDAGWGHLAAAQIALQLDDDEPAADAAFRRAVAEARDPRRARLSYAGFLQNRERWDDLLALWRDALAANPEDPTAIYMIGRHAAVSGQNLDQGLAHLDRFIASGARIEDIGPGAAHWRRARILEQLGRGDDALAALRRAVALDPTLEPAKADLERLADG